jgi:lipopolysaccharide export system permease protein
VKLKKIDIYIIKKLLGTYFYSILLLAVIIIIFDISEKIDDFIDRKAPLSAIIFDYYLNFIPYFVNMFSSLFTFIAVIYFTSRMAANTEIIAILSNGVSFWRMLRPYLISAIILTLLSFVLMNYVIPFTNRSLRNFEKVYIKNPFRVNEMNIHMQIRPDTLIYVENYNNAVNIGYRFSMEALGKEGLTMKMTADMIKWDSIKGRWKASNYCIRTIHENREILKRGRELDTTMAFRPDDFITDIEDAKIMTFHQLNKYIEKEKLRGNKSVGKFSLEKYKRITFPFANLVLAFIGVALSSRKVRGGIGMHLGMGIAIAFTFILLLQVTSVFAVFGNLPPAIALWIPNLLFAIVAIFLLRTAPK